MTKVTATSLAGLVSLTLIALPSGSVGRAALGTPGTTQPARAKWKEPLTQDQKAQLLLNRITFGRRPGDLELVEKMGLNAFLEQQLHPRSIDDSDVEARLANIETLSMTPTQLAEDFPPPQKAKRLQLRRNRLAASQEGPQAMMAGEAVAGGEDSKSGQKPFGPQPAPNAMHAPNGAQAGQQDSGTMRSSGAQAQGPRVILTQLSQEDILRAVYSNRQLQEVMVHFWMNHFNIYWPKGADRWYLTSFENNVIRPRALGNFEDLLVATAESPAVLFYLDNWMSAAPESNQASATDAAFRPVGPLMAKPGVFRPFGPRFERRPNTRKNARGLNENYGRELMELHTIGLHYTQQDVIEMARCFTGWTIQRPGQGGGFYFNPRMHDYGKKIVLGYEIPAGQGIEDGVEALHILATSPYTAQHIAYELCQRFVSDNPPPELVRRAAQTFLKSGGDICSVLTTILTAPEFYSEGAYDAKVKSPFEYVASTLRALGAQTDGGVALLKWMTGMGQPPFMYQAPSGYEDVASTWINSGALLARMNFAIALCTGRVPGTRVDWRSLNAFTDAGSPRVMMDDLAQRLVLGDLSVNTETAILSKLASPNPQENGEDPPAQQTRMLASLMIASPEFQRK